MFQRMQLNGEGVSYLKGELSQGGVLSQRLLEVNFTQGVIFTYIPNGFNISSFSDYSESIEFKLGRRVGLEFEDMASEFIVEHLDRDPGNVAIFETFWNINDPIVSKQGHQFFLLRSTVYDFILGSDKNKPVKQYLRDAQSYPTVIVLSTNFYSGDFLQDMDFNENLLEKITRNIDSLIIGAFDGEGFLFWSKL